MAAEDKKEAKPKKERYSGYYMRDTERTYSRESRSMASSTVRRLYKITYKGKGKYDVELVYISTQGQMGKSYEGPAQRKQIYKDVKVGMYYGNLSVIYGDGKHFGISKDLQPRKMALGEPDDDYLFYQRALKYVQEHE